MIKTWASRWRERLGHEAQDPAERQSAMDATNPAYIPRNHHVETMIKAAVEEQDFGPFEQLLNVLSRPYESRPGLELYAEPPQPHERVLATYCGT